MQALFVNLAIELRLLASPSDFPLLIDLSY